MPLPRLTLGTAQLAQPYGIANRRGPLTAAEAEVLLETAHELGVGSLDTAPGYGEAEVRIGAFLKQPGHRGAFEICNKLPPLPPDLPGSQLPDFVNASLESSLRRLGVERIRTYLVHRVEDLSGHGRRLVEALELQRDGGRIREIGVSVYSPREAGVVLDYPSLTVVQHPLNLLDRRLVASGRLKELKSRGITIQARSIFLQGLLRLDPDHLPQRLAPTRSTLSGLRRVLLDSGVTPDEVALSFVAAISGIDQVVIGAETPQQLRANVASIDFPCPRSLARQLEIRTGPAPLSVIDPRGWPAEDL